MGAAEEMGLLRGFIPSLPLLKDTDQEMVSGRVDLQSFLHLLVIQLLGCVSACCNPKIL